MADVKIGVPYVAGQGTSSSPGARHGGALWTSAGGNLWLFGGNSTFNIGTTRATGECGDLWLYSRTSDGPRWIWAAGSKKLSARGGYGTVGIPSTANIPGARERPAVVIDDSNVSVPNRFYLFGGYGFDADGKRGYLNDLWRMEPPSAVP